MSSEDDIKALNELYEEGKLGLRTILTGLVSSVDSAEENLENLKTLLAIPPEWSKLCFCKVMVDGGILTGTSYMRKPYDDKSGIFGINLKTLGDHSIQYFSTIRIYSYSFQNRSSNDSPLYW